MEREYEHRGHKYWVKVEPIVHADTHVIYFVAFVSDQKPGGILYGPLVRDPEGKIQLFATELSAFTNANLIKQSELDSK
jgi:hypothetical protein